MTTKLGAHGDVNFMTIVIVQIQGSHALKIRVQIQGSHALKIRSKADSFRKGQNFASHSK